MIDGNNYKPPKKGVFMDSSKILKRFEKFSKKMNLVLINLGLVMYWKQKNHMSFQPI